MGLGGMGMGLDGLGWVWVRTSDQPTNRRPNASSLSPSGQNTRYATCAFLYSVPFAKVPEEVSIIVALYLRSTVVVVDVAVMVAAAVAVAVAVVIVARAREGAEMSGERRHRTGRGICGKLVVGGGEGKFYHLS